MKRIAPTVGVLGILIIIVAVHSNKCQEQEASSSSSSSSGGQFAPVVVSADDVYDASEVVNKSAVEMLALRGFNSRVHFVRTADAHRIHVVRIINPYINTSQLKRPVVFNHGLLESATIWLINSRHVRAKPLANDNQLCGELKLDSATLSGPDLLSAPMMLANHGYDVWLMSLRGTDWSLGHDHYNASQPEFWDYSLDNFALQDVPAVVDFVSQASNSAKVGYVGHSQATFSVFALLSSHPEYADKMEPVVAVAPVAYMDSTTSFARLFFLRSLVSGTRNQNGPFPRNSLRMRQSFSTICTNKDDKLGARFICKLFESLIGGPGRGWRRGFFNHMPFFTSLKIMRHFGQIIRAKKFQRYDYGPARNQEIYGQQEPPGYQIERIRSRSLVLVWTRTDNLSAPRDVDRFKKRLTVPLFRDIFIDQEFNHFDLITHEDARQLVNGPLLGVFEHFERHSGVCSARPDAQQYEQLLNQIDT